MDTGFQPVNALPGYEEYQAAVARENQVRAAAAIGLNETICGLEVAPLNARQLGLLYLTHCPFLGQFTPEMLCGTAANDFADARPGLTLDIERTLWILSALFDGSKITERGRWESRRKYQRRQTNRDRFAQEFSKILARATFEIVSRLIEFYQDSFIDAEDGGSPSFKSFYSFEIAIAEELHRHYGYRIDFWHPTCPPEKNPLLVPLKFIFQLRKLRQKKEHGEAARISNRSDKVLMQSLARLNEKMLTEQKIRNDLRDYEAALHAEKPQPFPPGARTNFDLN